MPRATSIQKTPKTPEPFLLSRQHTFHAFGVIPGTVLPENGGQPMLYGCPSTWCHIAGTLRKEPWRAPHPPFRRVGHSRTRADRAKRKPCHQIPDVASGTGLVLWGQAAPPGADSLASWQALQAAGGLSQAEEQVPQGLGEMDCIPGDPPSPLYASLAEPIRGLRHLD